VTKPNTLPFIKDRPFENLHRKNTDLSNAIEQIGKGAAILSVVEIGLGSILHSFQVPTSGHWLSLNQSFWLSRIVFQLRDNNKARVAPMTLSNVTACLKSLSPAGKKLTPMLAISAQGALFNLGTLLLGRNVIGASLGSVLLSTWAFVQPFAIYYVIFGNTLGRAGMKVFEKAQDIFHFSTQQAVAAVLVIMGMKALLSIVVVLLARVSSQEKVEKYRHYLFISAKKPDISRPDPGDSAVMAAFKDLFHPLFLISFVLTIVFFFWSQSSRAALIWTFVRPLAVGFILFFSFRILPLERLLAWLEKHGFNHFAEAFRIAKSAVMRERHHN
jgi:hypothetical protein